MVRATDVTPEERRVLILAPTGRDAELAHEILCGAGINCHICETVARLCVEIGRGAGLCVVTEEACDPASIETLSACLGAQPTWSDLPVLLLTRGSGLA